MIPTMFWSTCYLAKINLFSLLPCVLRKSAAQQHCSHVHILSTGTFKQEGFNNLCFKICSHTLAGQQAHLQKCKSGLAGGDNKAKLVKHTHTKKKHWWNKWRRNDVLRPEEHRPSSLVPSVGFFFFFFWPTSFTRLTADKWWLLMYYHLFTAPTFLTWLK